MITIDVTCTGCGACISTCPTHALRPHPNTPLWMSDRCGDHRDCVEICPVGAIVVLDSPTDKQRALPATGEPR
jgi:NAD-dependent dihydropyrimidine dehydrogenase PreA subunit